MLTAPFSLTPVTVYITVTPLLSPHDYAPYFRSWSAFDVLPDRPPPDLPPIAHCDFPPYIPLSWSCFEVLPRDSVPDLAFPTFFLSQRR